MQVMILSAGEDRVEFSKEPLLFQQFNNISLLQRLSEEASSCFPSISMLVVQDSFATKYQLLQVLENIDSNLELVKLKHPTAGAAISALMCIDLIDQDEELLILNSNEYLDFDFAETLQHFRAKNSDAGVVVFKSISPMFSYVEITDNCVTLAAEKKQISPFATMGYYWFRKAKTFYDASSIMVESRADVDGLYYVSEVLNYALLSGATIISVEKPASQFHPLKNLAMALENKLERS